MGLNDMLWLLLDVATVDGEGDSDSADPLTEWLPDGEDDTLAVLLALRVARRLALGLNDVEREAASDRDNDDVAERE